VSNNNKIDKYAYTKAENKRTGLDKTKKIDVGG
jgi:hypothetical protein